MVLICPVHKRPLTSDLITVQIAVLLLVAALLMRPWRLVTQRRCELCRSTTSRQQEHCRFCGATPPGSAERTPHRVRSSDGGRALDELGETLWRREQVTVGDDLGDLGPVDPPPVEA